VISYLSEILSLVEGNGGEDNRNTILPVYLMLCTFSGASMQVQVGSNGVTERTEW
jgi:hypothetical protein